MQIASKDGVSIYVEEMGEGGLALLLLHYWGGSSRTWRHVRAGLANEFRTVAMDHRGWGQSSAPASGYALEDMAADVSAVIHALGLKRYVLVGHSMGGKVAQLLAAQQPEGLAGLVLVAPATPQPMAFPLDARKAMTGAYLSREAVKATIEEVLTAKPLSEEDREQVISDSLQGAAEAKQAWPLATSQQDISALVSAIKVPTLIISGELDRVDPPGVLRERLLPLLSKAQMHEVPATGHLAMLESPDALVPLIAEFCRDLVKS